jgi:hypothetical protein
MGGHGSDTSTLPLGTVHWQLILQALDSIELLLQAANDIQLLPQASDDILLLLQALGHTQQLRQVRQLY